MLPSKQMTSAQDDRNSPTMVLYFVWRRATDTDIEIKNVFLFSQLILLGLNDLIIKLKWFPGPQFG